MFIFSNKFGDHHFLSCLSFLGAPMNLVGKLEKNLSCQILGNKKWLFTKFPITELFNFSVNYPMQSVQLTIRMQIFKGRSLGNRILFLQYLKLKFCPANVFLHAQIQSTDMRVQCVQWLNFHEGTNKTRGTWR